MLTNSNYFSPENQQQYMSVSQWKSFDKCQAAALAQIEGKWRQDSSAALLIGSYIDTYFEGTLELFKADHSELFKRNGELKADFAHAEDIIKRIEQDKLFMHYMSGKKQVVMTGEIDGVPIKIKVDSYHDDKIVDLKIMRDFEPIYVPGEGRLPWALAWGYDLQGAVYQEIVRQNTGKKLPFFLAAATKETEPDIAVIEIAQPLLDSAMQRFRESLPLYDGVKSGIFVPTRCECCAYCRSTKKLTSAIVLDEFSII